MGESDAAVETATSDSLGFPVVGLGASAGGLEAVKRLLQATPRGLGAAFVLVQHLDPTRESLMVELLGRYTAMPVVQAEDGMAVEPDHVYVIPPNRELALAGGALHLSPLEARRGHRMPIDHFFGTLAEAQAERAIAVILSGTGTDGTVGAREVRGRGGAVLVQAPTEAQYDGMPASALRAGVVDAALPVAEIPAAIARYGRHPYVRGGADTEAERDAANLDAILELLRAHVGQDFRGYKRGTVSRRIRRRMSLHRIEDMESYLAKVRGDAEERKALFEDMMISVTSFFREPEVWEALEREVLPALVEGLGPGEALRVWVPACATGEEAYTLAILCLEAVRGAGLEATVQIFATDIDAAALDVARRGRYPASAVTALSPERLAAHFTGEGETYEVTNALRDAVVFSQQNLVGDPPFSKLDLISCRNLLIYLDAELQRRAIGLFHFALGRGGFLVLGSSETIGPRSDLFEAVSKKLRIYRRIGPARAANVRIPIDGSRGSAARRGALTSERRSGGPPAFDPAAVTREAILARFAPASVLVDRGGRILYFYGRTEDYIRQPTGAPTSDLRALVREGLATRLRVALQEALRERRPVVVPEARMKRDGAYHRVELTVAPLDALAAGAGLLLVSFRDLAPSGADAPTPSTAEDALTIRELERELVAAREELQETVEEMAAGHEELKAANEEVMSVNEELQSSNEELETSKEELQSLNEELNTVNSQLQEKLEELQAAQDDLLNFISSTGVATLFLDTAFRIQRFSPPLKKLIELIPADVGRPLEDLSPKFSDPTLLTDARGVLEDLRPRTATIKAKNARWYLRRVVPYRTQDKRIEGVVITFEDVTDLKRSEARLAQAVDELARSEEKYRLAQQLAEVGTWDWDLVTGEVSWTDEVLNIYGLNRADFDGSYEAVAARVHPDDLARWGDAARASAEEGARHDLEFRIARPDGEVRWVDALGDAVVDAEGKPVRVLGVVRDVTARKARERQLKWRVDAIERSLNGFDIISEDGVFTYANQAYVDMWGYDSAEEILGTSPAGHCASPDTPGRIIGALKTTGTFRDEFLARRKDGSTFWVHMSAHLDHDDRGRELYWGSSLDVTDRKRREAHEARSRRLLEALAASADVFVQGPEASDLSRVCGALVDIGGYAGAWIGATRGPAVTALGQAGDPRFVALIGDAEDDAPPCCDLVGESLRVGEARICRDIKDQARCQTIGDLGFGAAMIVPLRVGDQTVGVLGVSAQAEDAFADDEIALLTRLAGWAATRIEAATPNAETR